MGCWGITAFESDAGLDAVNFIRRSILLNRVGIMVKKEMRKIL